MLRIIKSNEPMRVELLTMCIYAPPGLGKSTLAYSAEAPLLLDFDAGAHRAANRKDTVSPIGSWNDVANMDKSDLEPYKTVIVDTAGRALDLLTMDIIADDPKKGRAGALTLQGYGTLKVRFSAWLKLLKSYGKDVVLIAHMDEQRNGDDIIERLDVQGGSKGEIYKSVDAMGRIFVRGKDRIIDFSPRENAFGKNPAEMEVLSIPSPSANTHFLADVITMIKERMNELSDEQQKAQQATEEWAAAIADLSDAEDFNRLLGEIKEAPKGAQSLFNSKAKEQGFLFNKGSKLYEPASVGK